ncbi:MAG: hypothetical protein KAI73_01105 [Rhodospirillaceae bacterium]|nr:hypothetical protein [Rhodospirillaceae bacterium]
MTPDEREPTIKNFHYQVQEVDPKTELFSLLSQVLRSYKAVDLLDRHAILTALKDMQDG